MIPPRRNNPLSNQSLCRDNVYSIWLCM